MLYYIVGNALEPVQKPAVILHICNDIGAWGKGFVLALSAKDKRPEKAYRRWFNEGKAGGYPEPFALGNIQAVPIGEDMTVINMIGQHCTKPMNGIPPIRYDALEDCLVKVYSKIKTGGTVHMPRIGAGLAGGDWNKIEGIIKKSMTVDTYVYTLPHEVEKFPLHSYIYPDEYEHREV